MAHVMDFPKIIARHRAALARVIAELAALFEVALISGAARLPRRSLAPVFRLLRPAESALRRLIIMAARDLKVHLPLQRPAPQGLAPAKPGAPRRMAFQLYDTRKRLRPRPAPEAATGPRIHFFNPSPLVPVFAPKRRPDSTIALARLALRLSALKHALAHLPQEAKRLARWRLRRALRPTARFTAPLRPGPPPGHQRRPSLPVDLILSACQGLAFDALSANTS